MWIADNRHRVLTHTFFWVHEVMIPLFGTFIINSEDTKVSVKDICERHILEDYKNKFIPTPQDFIQEMDIKSWMQNGNGIPPSAAKLYPALKEIEMEKTERVVNTLFDRGNMILDGKHGGGRSFETKVLD